MATYTVRLGESIIDVCYNTTGSMAAIDEIMDGNSISTYTPTFQAGTTITVPDVVYNSEAVQVANVRPFNSISTVEDSEIDTMISELLTQLETIN